MAKVGDFCGLYGIGRRRLLPLVALMIASAFTEGLGLVMLVPMLGVLTGGAQGAIGAAFARLGIPMALGPMLAIFVGLVVMRALINHARSLAAQDFTATLVDGSRARAWDALLHADWRTLSGMRRSDSTSRLISEVDRVGEGAHFALAALTSAVTLGGLALAALAIAPVAALVAVLGGGLVLVSYRGMRRRAVHLGEALSTAYRDVFARMSEGLAGLRLIKSFGQEDRAAADLATSLSGLRRAEREYVRDSGRAQIMLQAGGAVLLAIVVWLALERGLATTMTIVPLVALFVRAVPLLGALQAAWQNWSHARPAARGIVELIARTEAAREPAGDGAIAPEPARSITLDRVTVRFAGRGRPALDAVSLTIDARRITAITGASGAGKSTLADVLGGLIGPDDGALLIDGVPLGEEARRTWRARVAYVQQEPLLFAGSVRDNLRWADPDADDDRLKTALEAASARFVLALPDGMGTMVGEGGGQLSGGERQRIVLARALLRQPSLLILDEATSALDRENEAEIARALVALRERMTIVVIAHRGALTEIADTCFTLDSGAVKAD